MTSVLTAMSISSSLDNVEDKYNVDLQVLGMGHHVSTRECIDRTMGQRYVSVAGNFVVQFGSDRANLRNCIYLPRNSVSTVRNCIT